MWKWRILLLYGALLCPLRKFLFVRNIAGKRTSQLVPMVILGMFATYLEGTGGGVGGVSFRMIFSRIQMFRGDVSACLAACKYSLWGSGSRIFQ